MFGEMGHVEDDRAAQTRRVGAGFRSLFGCVYFPAFWRNKHWMRWADAGDACRQVGVFFLDDGEAERCVV